MTKSDEIWNKRFHNSLHQRQKVSILHDYMPIMPGSGGIEKSHSCKWAKWIQWHALPHIQQSTQQLNKGYYPNLHGWDFSIPPSPNAFGFSHTLWPFIHCEERRGQAFIEGGATSIIRWTPLGPIDSQNIPFF